MIKDADWQQRIGAPPERSRRRRRRRRSGCLTRFLAFVLVVAALAGWFWWQQNGLSSEEIEVASAPDGFAGYRIVLISDLHAKEFGAGNEKLIQYVKDLHPDLIAIVGDILHEKSQLAMIPAVASGLAGVAPTYYVTGNHEWASGRMPEMRQLLEETGVTYLSNTFVPLERNGDTITLAGIDDPNGYAGQKSPDEVAGEVKEAAGDGFWLLMAHRNNLFDGEYCRLGADLVLSGHGHGGIWRLPFTDGLLGAGGQLLPSFTNGFYRCTDGHEAQVFVTRGLGGIPRLFNHPQVAVLTFHCE